jgi:hypothetical protein
MESSETEIYEPGDILEARQRDFDSGLHFIIYLGEINEDVFQGVMITTKGDYDNNVPFDKDDFFGNDINGGPYKVIFKDSYFVDQPFLKKRDWGPFKQVGKLTKKGLLGVIENTKDKPLMDYLTEYLASKKIR